MGSLDENGIYIYDETDQVSPIHTYSNMGQASTSAALEYVHEHTLIMPVANAAERDAYASDMASAGRPASTARPLWVERADTGEVERNRGAGWQPLVDTRLITHAPNPHSTSWERQNLFVKKGGWVSLRIYQKRIGPSWSGDNEIISPSAVPTEFRPAYNTFGTAYVHRTNNYTRSVYVRALTTGAISVPGLVISTNNWLVGQMTWPTDD